jgi:hypothetical protein
VKTSLTVERLQAADAAREAAMSVRIEEQTWDNDPTTYYLVRYEDNSFSGGFPTLEIALRFCEERGFGTITILE